MQSVPRSARLGLLLIFLPGSVLAAVLVGSILGFALGIEFDGVAYLTSRHYGLRNFGLIYGVIAGLVAMSGSIDPVLANHVCDVTGSDLPLLLEGRAAHAAVGITVPDAQAVSEARGNRLTSLPQHLC